MAFYYYTAASLPMLSSPEAEPPLESEAFLEECRRFLSLGDYREVKNSTLEPWGPPAGGITPAFRAWEAGLRNELVRLRGKKQNVDPEPFLREAEERLETAPAAAQAVGMSSPLEAELFLDSQRWSRVEELAAGHFFDREFLQGYRLKLQLLERRKSFEEERGFTAYRRLYGLILEGAGDAVPPGGHAV